MSSEVWSKDDQSRFRALYRRFLEGRPNVTKSEKVTFVRFLEENSEGELGCRFMALSEPENLRSRPAYFAAWTSRLCKVCGKCFVLKDVCRSSCLKTPEGKSLAKKLERERACQTQIDRYGGIGRASSILKKKMEQTSLRRYGTRVPIAYSEEVRQKAYATMVSRYGAKYSMHCPGLVSRFHRSTFGVKKFEYRGRTFEYQGYEKHAIVWMCERYGYNPKKVQTQYENSRAISFIWRGKKRRYTPDIFLKEVNTLIEVKCQYTLLGSNAYDDGKLERNKAIQRACNRRGLSLRFVMVTKSKRIFPLPKDWVDLSRQQLLEFIQRKEHGA